MKLALLSSQRKRRAHLVLEQYAILDVALSAPHEDHVHADVTDLN